MEFIPHTLVAIKQHVKMSKSITIIFTLFFAILFISSCGLKKSKIENKITGDWEVINIINLNDSVKEHWVIESGSADIGTIYREISNLNTGTNKTIDTGIYGIEVTFSKCYFNTADLDLASALNAKWEIIELNKDDFMIAYNLTGTGAIQKEFVRK